MINVLDNTSSSQSKQNVLVVAEELSCFQKVLPLLLIHTLDTNPMNAPFVTVALSSDLLPGDIIFYRQLLRSRFRVDRRSAATFVPSLVVFLCNRTCDEKRGQGCSLDSFRFPRDRKSIVSASFWSRDRSSSEIKDPCPSYYNCRTSAVISGVNFSLKDSHRVSRRRRELPCTIPRRHLMGSVFTCAMHVNQNFPSFHPRTRSS